MHHAGGHGAGQLNAEIAVRYAIDRVAAGSSKAQLLCRIKTVQRVGGASQSAGTQRALSVHAGGGILHAAQVAQQHPGVSHQLVAKGDRLGTLQMGVTGHNIGRRFFCLVADGQDQFLDLPLQVERCFPQVQADIQRNLVVAAAAGVQPLASIAHAGGQSLLHKGVHILGIGVNLQRAAVQIVQNGLQALVDIVHILLGDDALLAQHSRVYHAAVDILFDHPRIKADGRVKVVHAAVHRFAGTSLPKLGHKKTSGVIVMNRE